MKFKSKSRAMCLSALCLLSATISLPANAAPMTVMGVDKAQGNFILAGNRDHSGGHHGGSMGMTGNFGNHFNRPTAIMRPPVMSHPRSGLHLVPTRGFRPFPIFRRHSYGYSFRPQYPIYSNRHVTSASGCDRYLRKARRTGSAYWLNRYDICRG